MIRPLLTAAAAIWALLLPAAAYGASRPRTSGAWHAFALGIYSLGSVICHQRVERSFHLFGAQLPVCARCTGIYFGAAITAVAYVVSGLSRTRDGFSRTRTTKVRLKADTAAVRILLAIAALPAALTLIYEWTTGVVPSNSIRAATGVVLGATVALVVLRAVKDQVN